MCTMVLDIIISLLNVLERLCATFTIKLEPEPKIHGLLLACLLTLLQTLMLSLSLLSTAWQHCPFWLLQPTKFFLTTGSAQSPLQVRAGESALLQALHSPEPRLKLSSSHRPSLTSQDFGQVFHLNQVHELFISGYHFFIALTYLTSTAILVFQLSLREESLQAQNAPVKRSKSTA